MICPPAIDLTALKTAGAAGDMAQAPDLIKKLEIERKLIERYLADHSY